MPDRPQRPETYRAEEATVVVRRGGTTLLGQGAVLSRTFEVEALLGRSASGDLYRAKHTELGSRHAIKVVAPGLAGDPHVASMLAQLGRIHDGALAGYEGLLRGDGTLRYIVMELVEGEPLTKILDQRRLETDEVVCLRDRLAKGLATAHRQGVVHRALSLDKIIVPAGEVARAKIVGFDLAAAGGAGLSLTTPDYTFLAPEQLGLFGGTVDARADIYSLGLVLAAAAIGGGKRLYMGSDTASAIDSRQSIPDLSLIPVALRPGIAPMLEPRPERRAVPAMTPAAPAPAPVKPPPPVAPARAAPEPRERSHPRENRPRRPEPSPAPAADPSPPARGRKTRPPRAKGAARRPVVGKLVAAAVAAILIGAGAFAATRWVSPSPHPPDVQTALAAATAGYDCAAVTYGVAADHSIRLAGHVATAQDLSRLRAAVAGIPTIGEVHFDVGLMTWPSCEVTARLAGVTSQPGRDAPTLSLGTTAPHPGDRLIVDGHAPAFDGYVYVDYYGSDGQVVHLLPTARDRFNLKPLRNHFVLGCPPAGVAVALDKPVGGRLITLIATAKPLFPELRPGTEPTREYLGSLAAAIGALGTAKIAAVVTSFDLTDGSGPASAATACSAK